MLNAISSATQRLPRQPRTSQWRKHCAYLPSRPPIRTLPSAPCSVGGRGHRSLLPWWFNISIISAKAGQRMLRSHRREHSRSDATLESTPDPSIQATEHAAIRSILNGDGTQIFISNPRISRQGVSSLMYIITSETKSDNPICFPLLSFVPLSSPLPSPPSHFQTAQKILLSIRRLPLSNGRLVCQWRYSNTFSHPPPLRNVFDQMHRAPPLILLERKRRRWRVG
jgi:hypothetical protein